MSALTRNQSLVLDALQSDFQPASAYTLLDRASTMAAVVTGQRPS